MDVKGLFEIILGAVGILGGTAAFFNGARKDSIIAVLTKENIAVKDYSSTLENTTARLTAERDGYKRQYEDAKDLAQGSPQLKILTGEFKKFNVVNQEILQMLKDSAYTLAKDTLAAREATEKVKSDLEAK